MPIYGHNEKIGLDNFIQLLLPSCEKIFVVTGNFPFKYNEHVNIINVENTRGGQRLNLLFRIFRNVVSQVKIVIQLGKLSHFSIALFHIGVYHNRLPLLLAKLLRKKIVVYQFGGNYLLESRLAGITMWQKFVYPVAAILSLANYYLADVIICEGGEQLIKWNQLERYHEKLACWVARYLNTQRFRILKSIEERPAQVGYFGRLDPKKGILNFVRAIPLVLKDMPSVNFVVSGTGPLRKRIMEEARCIGVLDKVKFVGFIDEDELVTFYNQLKLLVLPTYDDGVPEVVKEAMACGTPVAVTPVGGIPDLIRDGEESFIIHTNTPEGIARTIVRALSFADLRTLALNGRKLIEKVYTYEVMARRYEEMLRKVTGDPGLVQS